MNMPYTIVRSTRGSQAVLMAAVAIVVLAASLPWWGESSWMREFVEIACYFIFAMMWNLLAGYGGMVSIGQQAFFGLGGYPIPTDGPVGQMLKATRRSAWRPAHLHFMIQAPGYQTLITHVFRRGDQHLETDPVFGVRQSLIADWVPQSDGITELTFDFILNPQA